MRAFRFSISTIVLFTCAWPSAFTFDSVTLAQDLAPQNKQPIAQCALPTELAKLAAQLQAQVRQTFHLNHRERDLRLTEVDEAIVAWRERNDAQRTMPFSRSG